MSIAAAAEGAQFHVLAVDDSLMDRKLIERLLKISSYQVTTVDSGSKALEFLGLQEGSPFMPSSYHHDIEVNLIITDYSMPGMTGYDLLKRIKESSSAKDIPVVIMSAEDIPSRINRCLEGGAEDFLLKPVKMTDVVKLRPHILKGKSKENRQSHHKEQVPLQAQQFQQCDHSNSSHKPKSNNKRKATDAGMVTLPRTLRPGYRGRNMA